MSRISKEKKKENKVSVIQKKNQVSNSYFIALHLFNFISYVFFPCLSICLSRHSVPAPVTFEPVAQF